MAQGAPHSQAWVLPQLQLNREEDLPRELWEEGLPPAPAPSTQRHLSTSYLQYSHPLYPTKPRQILQAALPLGEAREAVSVCVCMGGVCACEHTNALRGRVWLQPKRHQSIRCRLKTTERTHPQGPRPLPSLFCLFLLQTSRQMMQRSPHSHAWIQGNPLKDFCDLWRLHHSFLEESFCLRKGQECLWCSAQTLVPRGSLGGEAILLVRRERLQAIHQGSR